MLKDKIKSLLTYTGVKQTQYAKFKGISPPQLSNKIRLNSFSVEDFIELCDYLQLEIKVLDKKGKQVIELSKDDLE